MKAFKEKLRSNDMFGHTINLNFNKEGDSHQTLIGGFFSIFIRLAMTIYVGMNFKKMLWHEDDSNFTEVNTLDLDQYGVKDFSETDMFMFHVIRKQKSGALFLSEDLERYIDISYMQISKDYFKPKSDPLYKVKTKIKPKQCELKDFLRYEGDQEAKKYFESWPGYSLICPDFDDFKLQGNTASMIQQYFSLEISKCDPTARALEGKDCATDSEIETYYEDIQVDAWALQEKMNFLMYGGKTIKPVFLMMDLYVTDLLNEKNVANNLFYIRRNIINTKDEFFYIGQLTQIAEYFEVGNHVVRPTVRDLGGNLLYSSSVLLMNEQYKLTRQIYNVFDLLGDLGGVTEVIMLCFGFFLYSISEHSFYITAS